MTDWDGYRWVPESRPEPRRSGPARRLFGASAEAALITLLMFGLIAGTTLAAKGGNGGNPNREAATCLIDGDVVSTSGLPTDEVINFMVTDANGTWGQALGFTWEGNWSLNVPDRNGPTTYEFVSRTYGNGGSKYLVFSSCSTSS
jgi:hypothetical protein